MELYGRQGDLNIIKVSDTCRKIDDKQDIELLQGEQSFHAHIAKSAVLDKSVANAFTIGTLVVDAPTKIEHINTQTKRWTTEHKAIPLEEGEYIIERQREYLPEGYRQVVD